MPKIIENLRERLLEETARQLERDGYEAVTVRSIASAVGVGVGTVYNYFPSKEALTAACLLEDWTRCLEEIGACSEASAEPKPVLACIYGQLIGFHKRHEAIFRAKSAVSGAAGSFRSYHALLRAQLAKPLSGYCPNEFTAEFIAESLLTWTMAGKPFDEIVEIIEKLF